MAAASHLARAGALFALGALAVAGCASGALAPGPRPLATDPPRTLEPGARPIASARAFAPGPPFVGAATLVLETTEGTITCALDGARAPRAVGAVIALTEGTSAWRAPDGSVAARPYYDGLAFFRAVRGVYAQTGCAVGDGSGNPGWRLPVERDPSDAARLARPGALFLARYHAPPDRADPSPPPPGEVIGAQLVVARASMSHLAGDVTVLGACAELDTIERVSETPARVRRARVVR